MINKDIHLFERRNELIKEMENERWIDGINYIHTLIDMQLYVIL